MDHRDLISYQKAKQLTKFVIRLSEVLPKSRNIDILYKQLLRSTSSVGANIVEGYGRNNQKEYKQFLGISRGSALEAEYWLEILSDSVAIDLSDIININKEVIKILTVTIKNLNNP